MLSNVVNLTKVGLVTLADERSQKLCARRFRFWPICLTAFSCSAIVSAESLVDLNYIVALTIVILGALILFTKSIQERFIWLIALVPLNMFPKRTFEIDVTAFDVLICLLVAEIILFYIKVDRLTRFRLRRDQTLAALLFVAIILSVRMSPLPGVPMGLMLRIFILLFLFFFGIRILSEGLNFLHILQALALRIVIALIICLMVPESGFEEFFGAVTSIGRRYAFSHHLAFDISISLPSILILMVTDRRFFLVPIMLIFGLLFFSCLSQAGFVIILADILCFAFLSGCRKRVALGLIFLTLLILLLQPVMAHLEREGINIVHEEGNRARFAAMISDLKVFCKYPIFGIGLNNAVRRSEVGIIDADEAVTLYSDFRYYGSLSGHNALSQVAAELGLVGLIPMLFLLGYYFKELFLRRCSIRFWRAESSRADNTANLIDIIVSFLFVNRFIWLMIHNDPFSPKVWMLFLVFSVWIKMRTHGQITTPV